MPTKITQSTLVPLSMVWVVGGALVVIIAGGSGWVTSVSNKVEQQAQASTLHRITDDEILKTLIEVRERLSGIEGELRRIRK